MTDFRKVKIGYMLLFFTQEALQDFLCHAIEQSIFFFHFFKNATYSNSPEQTCQFVCCQILECAISLFSSSDLYCIFVSFCLLSNFLSLFLLSYLKRQPLNLNYKLSSFLQLNILMSLTKLQIAKKYFHTLNTLNLISMSRKRKESKKSDFFYGYRITGISGTGLMIRLDKYLTFSHQFEVQFFLSCFPKLGEFL